MTVSVLRITSVICRQASVPVESRLAADSVTSVLHVTGDFLCVNLVDVTVMTRPTATPRQESVLIVNTTRRGKTVKFVRLVTMVMRPLVSVWYPRFTTAPFSWSFLL